MHEDAAQQGRQRRSIMFPKFNVIRRFADSASQAVRLVAFNLEVELDLSEEEIVEELEVRGYGVFAGR
jgi:hypothetical protein